MVEKKKGKSHSKLSWTENSPHWMNHNRHLTTSSDVKILVIAGYGFRNYKGSNNEINEWKEYSYRCFTNNFHFWIQKWNFTFHFHKILPELLDLNASFSWCLFKSFIFDGYNGRNLAMIYKINLIQSQTAQGLLWQFFWFLCLPTLSAMLWISSPFPLINFLILKSGLLKIRESGKNLPE